jgi:CheY-like chemotaxis protein
VQGDRVKTGAPLASRRILVVDDQPSIRGVLELALKEAGAEVLAAADGPAGLRTARASIPDLILLDFAMPGMSGWEVIEALMLTPRTAAIPVILQTTAEDLEVFQQARKRGVAAFISKPFRLNDVIETCRRILEGARPLQGRAASVGNEPDGPAVWLREKDGTLLGVGTLLDLAGRGAQVQLDMPLPLSRVLTLVIDDGPSPSSRQAEVRWVTHVGNRFHIGFVIRG